MTVVLSSLRANVVQENEGVWISIPEWPGVELLVRGFAYGPFQKAKQQVESKWVREYGRNPVDPDVQFRENGKLYANFLLRGWRGLDEEYSSSLAMQILTDMAYRDFHDHIRYATNQVSRTEAQFVEEVREDVSGNSLASSAGN